MQRRNDFKIMSVQAKKTFSINLTQLVAIKFKWFEETYICIAKEKNQSYLV